MKIAVDAMGGDNAPGEIVEGSVLAAREYGTKITLVGPKDVIEAELKKHDTASLPIEIVHASEVVGMSESPSVAYRKKKDSSIMVGVKLVKEGKVAAFVSAGNTGAVMAHGTLVLRLIPGISRAAITVLLPTQKGWSVLLDAGANVDCKPQALFEFGIMGSVYASHVLEKKSPITGLLNIGEEEGKGNEISKLTGEMLRQSSINFMGNVEAKEVYRGTADVIVCDGFVGNITLKVSESVAEMFTKALKNLFATNWRSKLGYLLVKPYVEEFKRRIDYHEYGGAPLLGLNGTVFICHGSSKAKSIKNAIKHAEAFVKNGVNDKIREGMERNIAIEKAMENHEGIFANLDIAAAADELEKKE
ncbi:MAG: phosphate acyltransferase PlsX [Nitrospinota bacterium]|nr:phosphate acyltransferase PlsX [Nitrospinota bacterium]